MIELFSEDDLYNPLVSAVDPHPIDVKYISFKNYQSESIKFYYGFWPRETTTSTVEVVTMNPLVVDPIEVEKRKENYLSVSSDRN